MKIYILQFLPQYRAGKGERNIENTKLNENLREKVNEKRDEDNERNFLMQNVELMKNKRETKHWRRILMRQTSEIYVENRDEIPFFDSVP